MTKWIAVLLFAVGLFAQDTNARYVLHRESSLSSSTEKLTVQQPTSSAKVVIFESATLYASAATDFTLTQADSAASTTALTPTPLYHSAACAALGYRSSNASGGTTIETYSVPAGGTMVIDLSHFYLGNDGTAQSLSIATNSVSGTVRISIQFVEK